MNNGGLASSNFNYLNTKRSQDHFSLSNVSEIRSSGYITGAGIDSSSKNGNFDAGTNSIKSHRTSVGSKVIVHTKEKKLVKEVFVCGPSALDITDLMETTTSSIATTLAPKVIYASGNKESNDSSLSKDIVPKICFPLDVETSVKLEKVNPVIVLQIRTF